MPPQQGSDESIRKECQTNEFHCHLNAFLRMYEIEHWACGSVVESADRLNVDQTAFSAQTRILEQQLKGCWLAECDLVDGHHLDRRGVSSSLISSIVATMPMH